MWMRYTNRLPLPSLTFIGLCYSLMLLLAVRYPARIVEVDDRDMTVLIHFDGWNQRYDEWVKMTSNQLRPLAESDRLKKEIPRTKSVCSEYKYIFYYLFVVDMLVMVN